MVMRLTEKQLDSVRKWAAKVFEANVAFDKPMTEVFPSVDATKLLKSLSPFDGEDFFRRNDLSKENKVVLDATFNEAFQTEYEAWLLESYRPKTAAEFAEEESIKSAISGLVGMPWQDWEDHLEAYRQGVNSALL